MMFHKMQALGNDFVVLDQTQQQRRLNKNQIQRLADRHFGVGCDQVLLLEASSVLGIDYAYRVFNADGSEVEQCGNGVRCLARYIQRHCHLETSTEVSRLNPAKPLMLATKGRVVEAYLQQNGEVRVNLGQPTKLTINRSLTVNGQDLIYSYVDIGNPHVVMVVDNLAEQDVAVLGELMSTHPEFPTQANVGFMQVVSKSGVQLKVYERHVGQTMACGSGAAAAVIAGVSLNLLHNTVSVQQAGGELTIDWSSETESAWMTGPAEFVYHGEIEINDE